MENNSSLTPEICKILGVDIGIPTTGSMPLSSVRSTGVQGALKWYENSLNAIKNVLNKTSLSPLAKAKDLKYWEGELKLARNNALADQADIVAISKTDPVVSFDETANNINKELAKQGKDQLSGDALWKAVLDEAATRRKQRH